MDLDDFFAEAVTLARLGITAGAPGSAAWATAATTTALHPE